MKTARHIGMIAAMIASAGIVAAQEVCTDWDKTGIKTVSPIFLEEGAQHQSAAEQAVDKAQSEQRWQKVPDGGDVTIAAVGATPNQQEYQTFYNGMGGWRWEG